MAPTFRYVFVVESTGSLASAPAVVHVAVWAWSALGLAALVTLFAVAAAALRAGPDAAGTARRRKASRKAGPSRCSTGQARAAKAASYYDLRRVDHAVGYFRQWIRDEKTPTGRFVPENEEQWKRYGERHFRLLSHNAGIVAEDLGVIPPFVRTILKDLGLPGYRVMRWERDDNVYRDPHGFPPVSLATTGTHDTEPVADWWEAANDGERQGMARVYPEFQGVHVTREFTPERAEAPTGIPAATTRRRSAGWRSAPPRRPTTGRSCAASRPTTPAAP